MGDGSCMASRNRVAGPGSKLHRAAGVKSLKVVSVDGKGVRWRRQVRNEKTNGSEPLMTRRKANQPTSKPSSVVGSGQTQTIPVYGLSGVRRGGGVISFQALMGNVGTCRFDAKGEIRRGSPPKEKSTEAKHRGGAARSSGEAIERLQSKGAASSGRSRASTQKGRSA